MDNSDKRNRGKEVAFWNLHAISSLYGLCDMMDHFPNLSQHSEKDREWRDFYFTNKIHENGQSYADTFIERGKVHLDPTPTIDRVALYSSQQYELNIIKHEFWNRLLSLKSTSKQNDQTKRIAKKSLSNQRMATYFGGLIFAVIVNRISGIYLLSYGKQILCFAAMLGMAEVFTRYKSSSEIFYSLKELPHPQLENQRKEIINQCLLFDGLLSEYQKSAKIDKVLESSLENKTAEKQKEIISAIGYKVIEHSNISEL